MHQSSDILMSYRNYPHPTMLIPNEEKQQSLFGARLHPSDVHHQPENNPFQRQDSLALASSLQQADRERYGPHDMLDFLETSMDIDQYLQTFEDLDVPADQVDLDDNELQKAHIIYDHEPHDVYEPFAHNEEIMLQPRAESVISSISSYDAGSGTTPLSHIDPQELKNSALSSSRHIHNIKNEPQEWEDNMPSTSAASAASRRRSSRDPNEELRSFTPSTKARKYNLKPDTEKANPHYKLKRIRNNDAVRKSRTKAKELQDAMKKDNQEMQQRIIELESTIAAMKKTEKQDKELIRQMMQKIDNCNCKKTFNLPRH